jgi:myosin heavy subunit
MGKWSPGLADASDCQVKDNIPLISWSWNTSGDYMGMEYGEKENDYNNLACAFDYVKNYTKSHGLWVCEDHKLFKDIKNERHGAYFMQEPAYNVCKLRYRHLPNRLNNLYERSRQVSWCGETHEARRTFHNGTPLTFNCKDMSAEYDALYKDAMAAVNYVAYREEYDDAFEEAMASLDLGAIPEVKEALEAEGDSVAKLKVANTDLETSASNLKAAQTKVAEAEAEKKAVESDQAILFGSLEAKLELHKQYSNQLNALAKSMDTLLKDLDRDGKRLATSLKRIREWVEEVSMTLQQSSVSPAQLSSLEERRKNLLANEVKLGCESGFKDFAQKVDAVQRQYARMEDELDDYERRVQELKIPNRFSKHASLLESGNEDLNNQVYRYNFVMLEGLFKLKEHPLLCRVFDHAQMAAQTIGRLQILESDAQDIEALGQRLQDRLVAMDKEIASQNKESALLKSIRSFESRFWALLAKKKLSEAQSLYESAGLYQTTTTNLVKNDSMLSDSQKKTLLDELQKGVTRINEQSQNSLAVSSWKNALWQRLEDVNYKLMMRNESGQAEIPAEGLLNRVSKIIPYDADALSFIIPDVQNASDLKKLETLVENLEQTVQDL